jgi:hypothetical protein
MLAVTIRTLARCHILHITGRDLVMYPWACETNRPMQTLNGPPAGVRQINRASCAQATNIPFWPSGYDQVSYPSIQRGSWCVMACVSNLFLIGRYSPQLAQRSAVAAWPLHYARRCKPTWATYSAMRVPRGSETLLCVRPRDVRASKFTGALSRDAG